MESPSWQLLTGLTVATVINAWIVRYYFRHLPDQILLGAVAVFYLLQCVFLDFYILLTGSAVILLEPAVTPNLNDTPFRILVGQILMPLVSLAVAKFLTQKHQTGVAGLLEKVNSLRVVSFEFILCMFSAGLVLYFVGTIFVRVPYLSAIIIYAHLSFYMTPLLIGLCWRRYKLPALIFGGAMAMGGVFALAAGSRSLLFLPMLFFFTGFWFTLKRSHRIWASCVGLVLLVPIFQLSALIENVRKEGQADSTGAVLSRVAEVVSLSQQASTAERGSDALARGVARMIMWSNIVAINYCPEAVPYRGFGDFWAEFRFLNRSTLLEDVQDNAVEGLEQDFGIGGARLLGFGITLGGVVPFPILADGWLRAGFWGATLFASLICIAWGGAERLIRRFYRNQPHFLVAFIFILLNSAYDRMGVYGFIYNVRYLIMQLFLWGTIFYFATKFLTIKSSIQGQLRRDGQMPTRLRTGSITRLTRR